MFDDKQSRDEASKLLSSPGTFETAQLLLAEYEVNGVTARYQPNETTLVLGGRAVVEQMIATGPSSLSPLTQTDALKIAAQQSAAIAIDAVSLDQHLSPDGTKSKPYSRASANPFTGLLSPLWTASWSHTIGVTLSESATWTMTSTTRDEEAAELVETSLNAGIAMLTGMIGQVRRGDGPPERTKAIAALEEVLASHQLSREGNEVTLILQGNAASQSEALVATLAPAMRRSRMAAQQTQQKQNMKEIMLALHNYHDLFGHFPPAVAIDKESGIRRSWRIEILPFFGAASLYSEYRKNEPWDSDANKKVLAQMPSFFRCSSDPDESTNTSAFAAWGKGLCFELNDQKGIGIRDIKDGTAGTIAIIDGRRDIPWTKTENVLIDVEADKLPEFGNSSDTVIVGLADGSLRAIPKDFDQSFLKKLFTRAGGEIVGQF